jgi:hypothetical protein
MVLVEPLADLAVEHLVGLVVAGDQIGHEKDAHFREHRRRGAARVAHRDIAGFDRVDDLELLGQQGAAVELHRQLALRALGHLLGHRGKCHRRGFGLGGHMREDQLFRRRLRESRRLGEREDAGGAGGLQDATPVGGRDDGHGRSPEYPVFDFRPV